MTHFNSTVAFREDCVFKNITGCFGFGLFVLCAFSGDWCGPWAGLLGSPCVGECDGVGFNLTSASTEVVIGTVVKVTAETTDLAGITWISGDVDAHGTVPLNGNTMLCFDVSVKASLHNLVLSCLG
jgi:hypothetical protein